MASKFELYDSRSAIPGSVSLREVIETSMRLYDIIEEETEGLVAQRFEVLGQYQDEKNALLDKLERQKKLIAYNRDVLLPYNDAERRDLEKVSAALERALTENAMQLIKAREVNRMVVQAISDAILREVNGAQGYSSPAMQKNKAAVMAMKVPPMQVDKVV